MKPTFIATALCLTLSVGIAGLACAVPPKSSCDSKPLSVDCGGARATITWSPKEACRKGPPCEWEHCTHTTLRLKRADGSVMNLEKPKGMQDYTAEGLACNRSRDGTPYFVVQYGEGPFGCEFCEWFHLYTTQGQLLTHSDPPILTDNNLPGGKTQYPNNKAFDALDRKLDLKGPEIEFFR